MCLFIYIKQSYKIQTYLPTFEQGVPSVQTAALLNSCKTDGDGGSGSSGLGGSLGIECARLRLLAICQVITAVIPAARIVSTKVTITCLFLSLRLQTYVQMFQNRPQYTIYICFIQVLKILLPTEYIRLF